MGWCDCHCPEDDKFCERYKQEAHFTFQLPGQQPQRVVLTREEWDKMLAGVSFKVPDE